MTRNEQLEQLKNEIQSLRIIRDSVWGDPNSQDQKIKENLEKFRKELYEKINQKITKYNTLKNRTFNKAEIL